MPARRNMGAQGEERTMENGRFDPATRTWECTAVNVACSCKRCKGKINAHCPHTYKNKGELQAHHRGHHGSGTGLSCKYQCSHETFQNRSNLRRHEKTCPAAPQGFKFKCPLCSAEHARSDNFKRHLATTHDMAANEAQEVLRGLRDEKNQSSPSGSGSGSTSPLEQSLEVVSGEFSGIPLEVHPEWAGDALPEQSPDEPDFSLNLEPGDFTVGEYGAEVTATHDSYLGHGLVNMAMIENGGDHQLADYFVPPPPLPPMPEANLVYAPAMPIEPYGVPQQMDPMLFNGDNTYLDPNSWMDDDFSQLRYLLA